MQMDTQYQPEAVASKDDSRPVLHAINIGLIPQPGVPAGIHVAMASDGLMAVAVPVELDEGDVEGLVSLEAFKQARKLAKKGQPIRMALLDGKVRLANGVELPRPEGTFPDLMRVAPDTSPSAERTDQPMIGFNPSLMASLSKALGVPSTPFAGVVVERFRETTPMVVYPSERGLRSQKMILDIPFALLMPFGIGQRPIDLPNNGHVTVDEPVAIAA